MTTQIDSTDDKPIEEEKKAPAGAAAQDESTIVDLNPKKGKKTDNIFLDFMALYSRASVNDKRKQGGRNREQANHVGVAPKQK